MLIGKRFWDGIAEGATTSAVRRWRRPTVRAGGNLRSPAGYLAIDAVEVITESEIDEGLARRCGYDDVADLLGDLREDEDGRTLYRIDFHLAGDDPRDRLRSDTDDLDALVGTLAAMDGRAARPWTRDVLAIIDRRPGEVSTELAAELGRERTSFKRDVAKLKRLGLTISLRTGYELSPRGRAVFDRLA